MKWQIVKSDFLALMKGHKLLFALLMAGIIISFYTFSMMIGLIQFYIVQSSGNSSLHAFSIDFNRSISQEEENSLEELLKNDNEIKTALLITVSTDQPMLVGWKGKNDDRWFILDEGRFLTDADASAGSKVMVISPGLYNKPDFDYQKAIAKIAGVDFHIVGTGRLPSNRMLFIAQEPLYEKYYPEVTNQAIHTHEDGESGGHENEVPAIDLSRQTQIIPYTVYSALNLEPDIVRLEYGYGSVEEYNRIRNKLSTTFPQADLYAPETPAAHYSSEMKSKILQAVLLIAMAMVNIAALFVYWLVVYRPVHTIYLICGARKRLIGCLIAAEWGIITAVSFLISLFIQQLTGSIMRTLQVSFEFSPTQVALILLSGYFLTILFISPQIITNTKLSLRGYMK